MKIVTRIALISVLPFIFTSCVSSPQGEQYVSQKIPVTLQIGKPINVDIRVSGNGLNDVGIKCLPEVWNKLTNTSNSIKVRLNSSVKSGIEIAGVDTSSGGTSFCGIMTNVHYLFYIHGNHAKASVEIVFANAPLQAQPAEIIVCKTPVDTGL